MRAFNKDKFSVTLEEEEKELNKDPQKSLYSYFVVSCIREGFKYKKIKVGNFPYLREPPCPPPQ